jgi:hypothetical protein
LHADRDASFTRSFDPCASILAMHCPGNRRWRGALEGIAAGQTCASGKNQHRGRRSGRRAARHPSPLSQGRRRGAERKGRWSRPSSLRGNESRKVRLPARRKQLQKSSGDLWSRISSAYAQQKLRQGRVNGDLARSERRWVKPAAGTASERSVGVPANARENGIGPDEDPGGARASSAVGPSSKRRCVGRGTGAVAATGSYEGSLSIEGIPDHTRYRLSRDGADGGLGGSPHPPIRSNP